MNLLAGLLLLCCGLFALTGAKVVDSSFDSNPPYADYTVNTTNSAKSSLPSWVFLAKFCFDRCTDTSAQNSLPPSLTIEHLNATIPVSSMTSPTGAIDNTRLLVYNDEDSSWTHVYESSATCASKVAKAIPIPGGARVADIKPGAIIPLQETQRPHYWYVVLANCETGISSASYRLHFKNPGGYYSMEFGFDFQGVLWIYSTFFAVFVVLLALGMKSLYRLYSDYHPVGDLEPFRPLLAIFSASVFMEVVACAMNIAHYAEYAADGVGLPGVHIAGMVVHGMSECTLVLLVILVAKGWNINQYTIAVKFGVGATMFSLYSLYIAMIIVGNLHTEQPTVIYIYDTTPGMVINGLRVLFAFILIAVFAAGVIKASGAGNTRSVAAMKSFMVILLLLILWLISGPIASAIAGTVSPWVREKTGVAVENIAQAYGFTMMLWVLWPTKIHQFFQVSDTGLTQSIAEYDAGTGDSSRL